MSNARSCPDRRTVNWHARQAVASRLCNLLFTIITSTLFLGAIGAIVAYMTLRGDTRGLSAGR